MECINCHVPELHPDGDKVLVRAFKVFDDKGAWSQCLVCSGYYTTLGRGNKKQYVSTPSFHNANKGWFVS